MSEEFLPILLAVALLLSLNLIAGSPDKPSTWYSGASVMAAWLVLLAWTQPQAFLKRPWDNEQYAAWLIITLAGLVCIFTAAAKIIHLLQGRRGRRLR